MWCVMLGAFESYTRYERVIRTRKQTRALDLQLEIGHWRELAEAELCPIDRTTQHTHTHTHTHRYSKRSAAHYSTYILSRSSLSMAPNIWVLLWEVASPNNKSPLWKIKSVRSRGPFLSFSVISFRLIARCSAHVESASWKRKSTQIDHREYLSVKVRKSCQSWQLGTGVDSSDITTVFSLTVRWWFLCAYNVSIRDCWCSSVTIDSLIFTLT